MPDLELSYDPDVWAPLPDGAGPARFPEAAATLARLRRHDAADAGRFLLLADPIEPPVVVDLSALALAAATSRAGAEDLFPDAVPEQLEEVQLDGGAVGCRYVRFPQVADYLPGEPGEEVFVAELHYVRAIPEADPGCVLIATVVTPRITELVGIAEQVESLVGMAAAG
jgi:hypothetical protein